MDLTSDEGSSEASPELQDSGGSATVPTMIDRTGNEDGSYGRDERKGMERDSAASSAHVSQDPAWPSAEHRKTQARDVEARADELIKELDEIVKSQARDNEALKKAIEDLRSDLEAARRAEASAEAELQDQTTRVENANRACREATDALDVVLGCGKQ
ncbi:hypothetical protein DL766_005417 [Monosporascus sp. MC13-8B]|uniref:GDP/GTP exchange factor Sec2 N-terminal domain-containing protein n=1 Tax=Monosporascus cannonballus TaxID=155416 RepID=A0ABY0GWI2_9PEZI|nr:hypothetical protein DL762_008528 [Monosporascus cannonballus]RYO79245.1 hypothetical protein DL763_009352 [Monosporascus cannonballus]RYP29360.1 hypothetical protein DL766_005417 [Monosporascus sp. MC13-8B]